MSKSARIVPAAIQRLLDAVPSPVRGFRCSGVSAGIKSGSLPGTSKKDVFLVRSDVECESAGVFTRNVIRAAPVAVCEQVLGMTQQGALRFGSSGYDTAGFEAASVGKAAPSQRPDTVFGNSGCANAVTGSAGLADALEMSKMCAGANSDAGLVMSTGVIGQRLNMDKVRKGYALAEAALDDGPAGLENASQAMMTTDIIPKRSSKSGVLPSTGRPFTVTGLAKGSGMIQPNMGTMLAVFMTDAPVTGPALETSLREATDVSFNCVTVDGDTSTNDTAVILANGIALDGDNTSAIDGAHHADYAAFLSALRDCSVDLARLLAFDGEGATRLISITASGCATDAAARRLALSVGASQLVKTAVHGGDANWGRILCAAGYAGVEIDPSKASCEISAEAVGSLVLLSGGEPCEIDEEHSTRIVTQPEVEIAFDAGVGGKGRATVWASDLTHGYIDINGSYRS